MAVHHFAIPLLVKGSAGEALPVQVMGRGNAQLTDGLRL